MTVSELIAFLQTQPQDLVVLYSCYSEQVQMDVDEIGVFEACKPCADGWVQNKRPDMETQHYLLFPGN